MGSSTFLLTVTFYDAYGREIQTQAEHLHGTDRSTNQVNFAGEIEKTILRHSGPNNTSITHVKAFCYDHRGRLIRTTSKLNDDAEIVLSAVSYDELGRQEVKRLHSADGQVSYLQEVDYSYNIRSWLTDINQVNSGLDYSQSNPDNDLFRMRLHYEDGFAISSNIPPNGPWNAGEFNGNISGIEWQAGAETELNGYVFTYDKLNRLTIADYGKMVCQSGPINDICVWDDNPTANFSTSYSYDLVGNLKTLMRKGVTGTNAYGVMDDLLYYYKNGSSNQLSGIYDNGHPASVQGVDQFVDGNSIGTDYFYDENGNVIEDKNKSVTIAYNHLNKPTLISFSLNRSISYVYDAAGTKLQQIVDDGNGNIQTNDYINGIHYEANALVFIANEEGRAVPDGSAAEFRYEYNIADHLGNVRVTFSDLDRDGTINADPNAAIQEVLQTAEYYPFGMRMAAGTTTTGFAQNYLYNGKELQEEFGLNWYDYGARMYNPQIARWNGVDALAEERNWLTPYNYTQNNPILRIDPDGNLDGDYFAWDGTYLGDDGKNDNKIYRTDKENFKK